MNSQCYAAVAMDLGVCQLRNLSISFLSSALGSAAVRVDNSSSGTSVVAIDNKIEQAMDLVKSHLMYAVREEVEVLKEQIKELIERNSQLEQENNLLKTLASPEQMAQFQAQVQVGGGGGGAAGGGTGGSPTGGAIVATGAVVAVVGNPSAGVGVGGNPAQPPVVANAPSLQGVVPNSSSNAQNAGASV